jgi:hypothetical protein
MATVVRRMAETLRGFVGRGAGPAASPAPSSAPGQASG